MVIWDSRQPWEPDDPRTLLTMELSEYRHSNGRVYIRFAFSASEGVMGTVDARTHAECLRHFADQIDALTALPVPEPPGQQ